MSLVKKILKKIDYLSEIQNGRFPCKYCEKTFKSEFIRNKHKETCKQKTKKNGLK